MLPNGVPFGNIIPQRGLRHGNPISHYLFIVGAETLRRLLIRAKNSSNFHGIKIARNALTISHLFYNNDLILFYGTNLLDINVIQKNSYHYFSWSSQIENLYKSYIFYLGNVSFPLRS